MDRRRFLHIAMRAGGLAVLGPVACLRRSRSACKDDEPYPGEPEDIHMHERWQVIRCPDNPIIRPEMAGLVGEDAANINGPSLIRVPEWVTNPLGRYHLYFSHHSGRYIRLAYSDSIEGPWHVHPGGTLRVEQTAAAEHVASPDVHVDPEQRQIRMYFHGKHPTEPRQLSYVATSADGLHFAASQEELGWFYFRVFRYGGLYYALAKNGDDGGILYRSRDGLTSFEQGPILLPRMRHAAVLVRKDELLIVYSRIGDCPESLLVCRMSLVGDWRHWQPSEPVLLLAPEREYEGAALPVQPSKIGLARGPIHELRDPALFEEEGRIWLLYSVAGEQGIAAGEMIPQAPR